jgi:WD40 repeat protein
VLESEIDPPASLLAQTKVAKLATSLDQRTLAIWYYEGPESPSGSEAHIHIMDESGFIDSWGIDGYDKSHTEMVVYPGGDAVAVSGNRQLEFDLVTGDQYVAEAISDVLSLAVSPNGQTLAVGYRGGWVDMWDADKVLGGREYRLYNLNAHSSDVESVGFSPESRFLATTEYGATKVWDVQSGSLQYVINHNLGFGSGLTETAFAHDGKSLAVCSGAAQCGFWRVGDGSYIGSLESESLPTNDAGNVLAIGFSQDDQIFATGWEDGSVWLWKDGQLTSRLQADIGEARVTAMVLSPGLERAVMGLSNGKVLILHTP